MYGEHLYDCTGIQNAVDIVVVKYKHLTSTENVLKKHCTAIIFL